MEHVSATVGAMEHVLSKLYSYVSVSGAPTHRPGIALRAA
jgi:hypothetical protein